jgi:2',3'-cyclic-nucleotide 2'-phosphodiesterase (5'-nucleotidase family)
MMRIVFIFLLSLLASTLMAQEQQLVLIYTHNTNGYLEPCECSKGSLGGLARRGAAIDSLRAKHPNALLVDAGNMLSTYHKRFIRDKFAAMGVAALKYDALNLGGQEFVNGVGFLKKQFSGQPLLSTNLTDSDSVLGSKFLLKDISGLRIAIVGITTPNTLAYVPLELRPSVKATNPVAALRETLAEIKPLKPDVIILLLQAAADGEIEKQFATLFPELTIIVSSYEGIEAEKPVVVGKTHIIAAGHDGEKVGVLSLTMDRKMGKIIKSQNALVPLSPSIKAGEALSKLVEDYKKAEPQGAR